MGMPAEMLEWTADMARALPADGNRYEVLDGALFVTPAPRKVHQLAVTALIVRLAPYVRANGLGETLPSPADIEFSPRRLVQPDVFVVPKRFREWRDITSLLLVIEILSPSTARADRHRKRLIYQSEGVPEYWIVDLDGGVVERWRPGDERPEILAGTLTWQPRADVVPLSIALESFFAEILEDEADLADGTDQTDIPGSEAD
jgi:Uma2 family endonuclease